MAEGPDTETYERSPVIFRSRDNVLKLLLWQDLIPVRRDIYRMVEILELLLHVHPLPPLIRSLIGGLEDKLVELRTCKNYVEVIEGFFRFKPMYHTCLNTYYSGIDDHSVWKYYLRVCLNWRNSIILNGCHRDRYASVNLAKHVMEIEETAESRFHREVDPDSDVRVKAIAEYLKFFGPEGKKHIGKNPKNYDGRNPMIQLNEYREEDDEELKVRQLPSKHERVTTKLTKKQLKSSTGGVESRFNVHVTLIPYRDEIITEGEFIERMERRKKGYQGYYTYTSEADNGDVIAKAKKEYFARVFEDLMELNGEQLIPYDKNTGEVLPPTDKIEESIRKRMHLKQRSKASLQTLGALAEARKGKMKTTSSMYSIYPTSRPTSSMSMRVSPSQLTDIIDNDETEKRKIEEERKRLSKDKSSKDVHIYSDLLYDKLLKKEQKKGNPIKRGKGGIDINVPTAPKGPDPNAIPRSRVWNKYPGGFCLDGMRRDPLDIIEIVSDSQSSLAKVAESLSIEEIESLLMNEDAILPGVDQFPMKSARFKDFMTEQLLRDAVTKCKEEEKEEKKVEKKQEKKEEKKEEKPQESNVAEEAAEAQGFDRSQVLADWARRKCYVCGKIGDTKRCAKCHGVNYCSRECQLKDWKGSHKYLCALIQNEEN